MTRRPLGTTRSAAVVSGALTVLVLFAAGCASSEPSPVAAPGAPTPQTVPQMTDSYRTTATYCLAPNGSALRVFESHDGHGARIASVVRVDGLPLDSPWRCP